MSPRHVFQGINLMNLDLKLLVADESEQLGAVVVQLGGRGDGICEGGAGEFDVFGCEGS